MNSLLLMQIKVYLLAAFALLASSCMVETLQDPLDGSVPSEVFFSTPSIPIVSEDGPSTKVSVSPVDASNYLYLWEAADTVGVFPSSGSQVFFSMSEGAGTTLARFDGDAWSLRGDVDYYSYYPFVGDMYLDSSHVPVHFTGQHQASTSSFSGCNIYMASSSTTTIEGELGFSLEMLNTMLRFDMTLPEGTYTKLTLSLNEPLFVKEGYYNLSSPSIVAEHYTKTQEVVLDNFTVSSANSPVSIYTAQAPLDLRGQAMTVSVYSSDGRRYTYVAHPGRAYVAGKCYLFNCTMTTTSSSFWMDTNVWHIDGNGDPVISSIPEYSANQSIPYLHWYNKPSSPNGTVAILLGGEDYNDAPNMALLDEWAAKLTARGVMCVALMYRTPRGAAHYCRSAWQDAQRAVRIIRNAVWLDHDNFPFDKTKIGVVGWSAGAHLGLMMATCSQTAAYPPLDTYEGGHLDCNINWAILDATAYATADSDGRLPAKDGSPTETAINPLFAFDGATPPICLIHGEDDPYTPMAATLIYRQLRMRGISSEVHLYPGSGHDPHNIDRGIEFLAQKGFLGTLGSIQLIENRYASDAALGHSTREYVWPSGRIPNLQENQSDHSPWIEWDFPAVQKSKAIQIIYSGGSYNGSNPFNLEVAPIRRYLNAKGVTVVTLCYRYPRPQTVSKHTTAWQDLQRTIRIVRSKAEQYGLDPDRIGIMGFSAGGHLTLMGATSSTHQSYSRIDAIDDLSCTPQWAIAFYPAYTLTDDDCQDHGNSHGGNLDTDVLMPEFSFDRATSPMLLIHGDADPFSPMASVKTWEKLRSMGIPAECHTYATLGHCLQWQTYPGTGGYSCFDRVWEYMEPWLY